MDRTRRRGLSSSPSSLSPPSVDTPEQPTSPHDEVSASCGRSSRAGGSSIGTTDGGAGTSTVGGAQSSSAGGTDALLLLVVAVLRGCGFLIGWIFLLSGANAFFVGETPAFPEFRGLRLISLRVRLFTMFKRENEPRRGDDGDGGGDGDVDGDGRGSSGGGLGGGGGASGAHGSVEGLRSGAGSSTSTSAPMGHSSSVATSALSWNRSSSSKASQSTVGCCGGSSRRIADS
mmetsp:Transcript_20531/g.63468  ORF Transcript_20531/g.63468 Transcript_20531/m.63468 type:complete len:231 (-) Transcript_20531:103-795(-)